MMRMRWAVVSLAIVVSACGSSTMAPSSPSAVSRSADGSAAVTLQPLLARLGQAENAFNSANHHLVIVTQPSDPCYPNDPCHINHLEAALDFYQKGNDILDDLAQRILPQDPCAPEFIAGVHAIGVQVSLTQQLVGNIPPTPITEALVAAIGHAANVSGGALRCGRDGD